MSGPGGTRAGSGRRATGSGSSTRGRKGQVIGGYLIGEEIGKGAYGRVYKGINQRTGNVVAVKEVSLEGISDEDLRGIMSEIDLLKTLAHKNIVKYLSSAKSSQHLYIMLEFVENGSLSNFIRPSRFGAFPESLVVLYISQVLEGLAYLHDQGVIHRDIKGANILTTKQGLVKLADFGVATRLSTERSKQHVVGTPYWMSPEMIEMKEVTTLSDIWSVGCTVIELLTSEPPYHDLEPMQALYNIVNNERPPLPNGISDLLADFLKQCFHKDQRKRPTARTLLQHPWIQKMQNDLKRSWPRQKRRPSQTDNGATKKSTEEHLLPQFSQDEQSAFHQQHQQRQYQPQPQQKNGVTTVIQRMLEHEEQQGMQENMGSRNEAEGNYEYDPEVGRRLASWLENVGSASAEEERSSRTSVRDGTETVMTNATSRDNTSRTATAKTVTSKGGDSDELRRLLAQLRPEKRESALTAACEKLAAHSASASETKAMQIALQATQPLAVLLEHSNLQVQEAALAVAEKLAAAGESPLFYLSLLGLLPPLIKLCASGNPSQVRLPAARTISHVSATRRTVEMLIACQATPKLVELFEEDYKGVNIDLAQVGLEVMTNILSLQEVAPIDTDAFMQLLARGRLPDRLSKSLESMSFANDEDVRLSEQGSAYQHMQQASKLLLELSQGRGACVEALCRAEVLSRIVQLLDRVNAEFRLQLLEVIKYLSHHESAMEALEQAGAIQILIPYLHKENNKGRERSLRRASGAEQIEKQQLASLFALCNICSRKKGRQEKAALAGAVGPLVELSRRGGVYESAIMPVLCGMAQASRRTRGELWRHHVLERLMECLDTDTFRLEALEAAVAWLSYEPGKAEPVMLQASQLERLTEVFCSAPRDSLVRVMELMLRLVARASRVAAALARGRLGKHLVQLLHSSDPSISLMALKMVKAVYEVHPAPKELAATLNLHNELQSISTRDGQLQQQLAQQLLSALQVATFV